MEKTQNRLRIYWIVGIGLSFSYLFLRDLSWVGSNQLHTLMEVVATILALFVGVLSLVQYYSRGGINFLILGAGFIGVAFLDGYHAVVTSVWFMAFFPSELSLLSLWSWLASRLFLSVVIFTSFIALYRQKHRLSMQVFTPKIIYVFIATITLLSFLFFVFVPLSSGYFEGGFFYRPEEFIPAVIFLIAFIGLFKLGYWKTNQFDHWLMLAIIVNLVSQVIFMPYSDILFDIQFDMAHLLKKVSYICVLTGLCISAYRSFKIFEAEIEVRKKAQHALEASKIRNSTLVNSLVDGLITISETGIIESFNKAASDLFGYSKLEVLGRNIKMLMPDPYHSEHDGYLSNYLKTGHAKIIGMGRDVSGLKKDGSIFPMDLSVSEMNIGGKKKFSGIVRDDTERLRAKGEIIQSRNAAESAAKAKGEFLATMSHEIRTPMNGVLGMVELLQDTPLDNRQKDIVKTISDSGSSLLEIINDVLEFSKIEAGRVELNMMPFNLERTVYDVSRLLMVKAEEKNIELIFYFHSDCPNYVVGDAGRIRQVLLNLVGNAIKFTSQGQVVVEVICKQQTNIDCDICIEVTDTGIGINEEEKERLFESFTQADGSTSRKFGGTGLGLSISKQLVDLMGGVLDVTSEPGKGSTFWMALTMKKAESPTRLDKVDLDGVRVLIVDDNTINLQILREQLTGWNMWVDEATSPKEVVQRMWAAQQTNKAYKLALIDNMMPGMNGEQLGRKIKSNKELTEIPLVLLTSTTGRGTAAVFREVGFSAYVTKPILSDLLYETLSRTLGLSANENNKDVFLTRHTVMEDEFHAQDEDEKLTGNILLVEDVLINQKVALGLMDRFNLNVDVARNGKEAIEKYKQKKYDLILMDCQMPIMDGFEATKKIRETNKDITIIAVTANALSSDKAKCIEAGMTDYLAKPFNRKQLTDILVQWLKNNGQQINGKGVDVSEEDKVKTKSEVLNINKLEEMKVAMGPVFNELLPAYVEQSDEMVNDMMAMLEKGDLKTLERYAHSMKSSSLNVGAENLSQLSAELEEMSRDNDNAENLKNKIELVCSEYEQVKPALLQYQQRGE
jgi:PAS domain S-box-containing protein